MNLADRLKAVELMEPDDARLKANLVEEIEGKGSIIVSFVSLKFSRIDKFPRFFSFAISFKFPA